MGGDGGWRMEDGNGLDNEWRAEGNATLMRIVVVDDGDVDGNDDYG